MSKNIDSVVSFGLGIIIGVVITTYIPSLLRKNNNDVIYKKADDNFQSLFYSTLTNEQLVSGIGFPNINTIDTITKQKLLTIQQEYKRLDINLYKQVVENMVITCIDIIIQRKVDGKLLLFYRRDAPAKGIWWWPGGRLFRGETFDEAAKRKIKDETGICDNTKVLPIGIIDCWNTFFPDSNWDEGRRQGYEGTQTVNLTIFCRYEGDDNMDTKMNEIAKKDYAVEAHKWITVSEGLSDKYDKYVRLNIEKAIQKSYLHE